MTGIPPSEYAPIRVKWSQRWSRAICSRSEIAGIPPVAVISLSLRLWSCWGGTCRGLGDDHFSERRFTTTPLPHDVDEHQPNRDQEDHRSDYVDLCWYRNASGAPDEQRERRLRPSVEVRDDEIVDRQRERDQPCRHDCRRDQRQRDLPEGDPWSRPQVHRSFLDVS